VEPGDPDLGDRLRRIEAVTDTGLARLDVDELLEELLDRVPSCSPSTPPPCCCCTSRRAT
jgi:hypothetical protein